MADRPKWKDLSDEFIDLQRQGYNPLLPANIRATTNNAVLKSRQMELWGENWNPDDLPEARCGIVMEHDPHQTFIKGDPIWCPGHDSRVWPPR